MGNLYIKTHLMLCFSLASSLCRIWWPKCEPCLPPPRPSSLPILKKDVAFFWPWQLLPVGEWYSPISGRFTWPTAVSEPSVYPWFISSSRIEHRQFQFDCVVLSRKCEVRWSETWVPGFTAGVRKPLIRQEIKSQLCFWCTENQMWNNVCLLF